MHHLERHAALAELGAESAVLREHFRRLQDSGRSASSINPAIAAARSSFRWLAENRRLESSPTAAVRSIRTGPHLAPKHLTVD